MKLEDVLPAYRAGKKITMKLSNGVTCCPRLGADDNFQSYLKADWEIVDDPITITREQFERAWERSCENKFGLPQHSSDLWEEFSK